MRVRSANCRGAAIMIVSWLLGAIASNEDEASRV